MTNLTKWLSWTLLVTIHLISGTHSGVIVSPPVITVVEGNNATARCIYDGENSLQGVSFSLNKSFSLNLSAIAIIFLPNCTFNTLGLDNYMTDCEGNKTAVITLVNVSRNDHGKTLTCTVFVYNSPPIQSSTSTILTVNVPVKKVTVSSKNAVDDLVSVCEKTTITFLCKTSVVRPSPNISWIFQNKHSAEVTNVVSSIILEKDENHLDIASSKLNVTANRSLNNQKIFCSASNILDEEVNSSNIQFNISYPPVQSPSILNLNITNGDTYSIIEGRHGLLTCAVPESNPDVNLSWNGFNNRQDIEKTIVKNRLEWNASRHDTNKYTCIAKHHCNNYEKSISVMINVLYSPTVKSMKNISIMEGSMLNITCNVILGIPKAATFKWTRQKDSFITESQVLMIENISRGSSSTYTCTVTNIMKPTIGIQEKGESSGSLEIDVLYPPTVDSIENFTVIEGSHFNLSCPVNPGNPHDTNIYWSASDNILQSVTKILSFHNVSRKHDMIYTCTVSNIMKPTDSNEVKGINSEDFHLIVEYPPTVKSMKDISIIEGSMLNITCNVTLGKPKASSFRWTRREDIPITNSQLLMIPNISRDLSSNYTCTVANIMKPTYGNEVRGESIKSIYIDVLYPPTVESIEDFSITEGSNFSFSCPVNQGNPNDTEINWSANGYIIKSGTKILSIHNVSRKHDMIYTCTVSNIMKQTDGNQMKGKSNESFRLNVEYSATIDTFFVEWHNEDRNVTLNEHDNVTFICSVVSNPVSTIAIKRLHGDNLITANLNNVTYNFGPADCLDAGTYECSGRNKHNLIQNASRMTKILVNCSPRAYPNKQIKSNITTALNVPVVLNFSALAYPLPIECVWQKFIDNKWENISAITNIIIYCSGLTSSLTINSTREENFGHYRLNISNPIGSVEHDFFLSAEEHKDEKQNPSDSIVGVVIGVVFGVMGAVVIVILVVFILRKRQNQSPGKSIYQNVPIIGKTTKSNFKTNKRITISRETNVDEENLQEVDDVPQLQNERTEYYNSLDKIGKIDRINVSELFQYVLGKNEDEFAIEYQKIPTELQMACTFARKPENIALNRYNGIYPYDHSRVKIPSQPDFFMNACYIDGFQRSNAYIASLGPTEKTTQNYVSFWQMVWHERSDVIVMLTNLREPSGMKCEQYWPDVGSMTYGEISVSCVKTEIFAEYTTRTFTLSKINEKFTVTQLHYTAWPDKTVPEDVTSLLEFRQRMIATPTTSQGPIIVHCSAGIGRTGTLIAIDRLVAEGRDKHSVNVFECVTSMRKQRVKMVQTLEQYIFIYKALVTALSFDCEVIPVKDFPRHVDGSHSSKYSRQYQQLKLTLEKDKKDEREARERNEKLVNKNRIGADIPGDRFRVFLCLDIEGDENYINAVYINSLKKKDMFIMGQTPLPSTVKDFICMIYQENCICIVTMDDLNESEKTIGKYIFENGKKHAFGNFNVSTSILEAKHHYILREMKIKYEGKYDRGEKRVYHFQYKQWLGESDIPNNAADFVRFVQEIQQYANELGDETSHILVHCMKANERSGIFCAVAIIMEMLQVHDCASVTNTVRRIRTRRRSAITSQEQLLFCYQAGGAFIQQLGR